MAKNSVEEVTTGSIEKIDGEFSFEEMMEAIDYTRVTPIVHKKQDDLEPDIGHEADASYELKLQAIGYEDRVYSFVLAQGCEYTIGRTSQSDYILDGQDKRLSGIHCKVCFDNNTLYIWDMNSTNGTFVNGIPIQTLGKVAIHSGETIRAGSYEYRIG